MAFQLKSFTSIVAAMINHVRGVAPGLTDFNVGSVIRTLLEAPAVEMDELYQQMFNALRDAIPVATYQSFNFDRLPAIPASGQVTVTVGVSAAAVTIPAGTVLTPASSRLTFTSLADVTIAAGVATGILDVVASGPGVAGNVPVSTPFTLTPAVVGFVSAANASAFQAGRDLESDAERKQRFVDYIRTLQRSTLAGLVYGAKTVALFNAAGLEIERVKTAAVVEPYVADNTQPISLVNLYVHNGVGATSGGLVAQVAQVIYCYTDPTGVKIPGWKAAGVHVVTAAAAEVTEAITGAITLEPGAVAANVIAAAETAMQRHFLDLDIGAPSLFKDRVILIGNLDGVANIVFSVGTADMTPTASQKLMPGAITFTAS